MNSKLKRLAGAAAGAFLFATPVLAADALQGMIISHHGNKLVVRGGGADTTVMLTGDTKIQSVSGLLHAQRDDHPPSDLINGLQVKIDTIQNGAELDAAKVTFSPGDLKTAMAVQAGTDQARHRARAKQAENEAKQAENERRFSESGQFVEKGRARVLFATGSAKINPEGEQALQDIAKQAEAMPGALLRIVGHTDSTGNAAANQRLSAQRASAVTAYLYRACKVPPEKIASSGGLGSNVPADEDDSAAGLAQNRRVTVFIVVSKVADEQAARPPG